MNTRHQETIRDGCNPSPQVTLFNKCVVKTCRGRSIRCCLGLWGVFAQDAQTAEREARHYWQQYYADGEYDAILSNNEGQVRRA